MKQPWFKFFPTDWQADPALRTVSLSARGLWIEMLCICHQADPRGDLKINNKAVDASMLSRLTGGTLEETKKCLQELEDAGVFSRRKNGVIYSRRMEKDENRSRKNRENGSKGGNPSLCNIVKIDHSVNPEVKTQKPEARIQKPESKNKYIFTGNVIRLKEKDFKSWEKAFPDLHLPGELIALDAYLLEQGVQKDWFARTAAALKNRQNKFLAERTKTDWMRDDIL